MLVVGSIGLDTVETPLGRVTDALGGSAIYFSAAASYFAPVEIVGVVGEDFPLGDLSFLTERGVDLSGVAVQRGQTFRWAGRYALDLNVRETLDTQLNVFASFRPALPEGYRDAPYVFLANIDPELQLEVLGQMKAPAFVACDTMNFWIAGKRDALSQMLRRVDAVILNDSEVRELARIPDLIRASRAVLTMGPEIVIVKKGEHGALMISPDSFFFAPAFPTEHVLDPTGAGDCFAGGFMGYLARTGDLSDAGLRRAVVYGSVMASFNVERFSVERLKALTPEEIQGRFDAFRRMMWFEVDR